MPAKIAHITLFDSNIHAHAGGNMKSIPLVAAETHGKLGRY